VLAGVTGAFPVDASPPRTAVVAQTRGVSQLSGLFCAAVALGVLMFGARALAHVPRAALAGVLLFIGLRIVRVGGMIDVWRRSRAEFLLIAATALAILALPIQEGVSIGIILSLLHGVWTTTHAQAVELRRIPGTSIWWPPDPGVEGQAGVKVIALQAPLSFLNAYDFRAAIDGITSRGDRVGLVVIEATALVEIDYTGATVLEALVHELRAHGTDVAVARLESLRAQHSFAKLGLAALIGRDHIFHSVQEAVDALAR
jgi:MFS superfamily sulfate permease-like transporter